MRSAVIQHGIGVAGQVAAALPVLLMTVLVSREAGLEIAGIFTVVAAASAATFSAGMWGLRNSILLDRFQRFPPTAYFKARTIGATIATLVTLGIGSLLNLNPGLTFAIVFYRLSDSFVDLGFAFTQSVAGTSRAIWTFAILHGAKLLTLFLAGVAFLVMGKTATGGAVSGPVVLALSGFIVFGMAYVSAFRLMSRIREPGKHYKGTLFSVYRDAIWFAVAGIACAALTSSPRISLPWLYTGDELGVVGVSLSVATFFGMVFFTSWVRHLPKLGEGLLRTAVTGFLLENLLIAVGLILLAHWVLSDLVAWIFGFSEREFMEIARKVLIASVPFFAAMNLANLFKVTQIRWMETVTYLAAILVTVAVLGAVPGTRTIPDALWISAITMMTLIFSAWAFKPGKGVAS